MVDVVRVHSLNAGGIPAYCLDWSPLRQLSPSTFPGRWCSLPFCLPPVSWSRPPLPCRPSLFPARTGSFP